METFMFLLFEDETTWPDDDPAAWEAAMAAHDAFSQHVEDDGGEILGGHALMQTPAARTVRGAVVTDGPFAETKEQLGGYYVVKARDLDHAVALAAHCPVGDGCVEVRPTVDTSGEQQHFAVDEAATA